MSFPEEDEVVISGIGGKFPEVGNVAELAERLFAGDSLVTKDERVLTKGFYENLPEHHGKAQNNSVMFDNTFFGISTIVAMAMDPITCQILQRAFEAVIDAGINPSELRGTPSAVFSGTCHSDSDLEWATDMRAGYGIMGRNRCMNSNRVSYWLDLNGTSVSTDSGWTNGLSNLYLGWNAIKSGRSDIAIVSTANLQCHALITIQFADFGILSPDGISRTFDDSANGTGRSSAVVVFVLQRASLARRSYATIGHIFFSCFGDRDEIIQKPTQREWEKLFRTFYEESKIDVNDVQYIEAHGSSNRVEDAEELNAIAEVFCKNRKSPLLVGCVKSNIGHTEASSAFCGIIKSIISLENGIIPQNLHYTKPNSLCPALVKGQIKVVDKNTPIQTNGWFAVNSHGYGGTYAHIVLKANPKNKTLKHDGIPRLVLLADRTNDYMDDLINKVESTPYDPEFVGLLQEIHSKRVEKYLGRGYTILPKPEKPVHDHQVYGEEKRPIWFIFSGMGSQWPKMGRRLMDFPKFRESIERSHKLLETKGLDLINIISTEDPKIFDNILHSFVGIAAIQVALVDILKALKVTPDGLIGHSVGELGCAYADGCFTAEQMVLAAYYRGRASTETELVKGSMAAVGKGYNSIKDELPEGIEVACHNSDDSCTLSGPIDLIHKYVAELKEKGVFARSVNVSNIAYHSRYIRPAAPKLLAYLKQVVTDPKPRSSKWISTSNPESAWDTDVAKYCSAEYHTNNLLSSVLFEEGSKHIPKNAICIEVAPHGLLQAILKRSLGSEVTNISLTSRTCEDPLIYLLQSIGKMYIAGVDPCIINLYPRIEYPVSRGTHILHHLVHWHEQKAAVVITPMEKKVVYSFKNRLVSTADDGTGYILNEQNIYPISVFLELAWEIFASFQKRQKEECPVLFQDFHIENPLPVHLLEDDNGSIAFQCGSGNFEIFTDRFLARGNISLLKEDPFTPDTRTVSEDLTKNEIYTEIQRKGFGVGECFRTLNAVSLKEEVMLGEIPSTANWVQSIESLIQLYLLQTETNLESQKFPCSFEKLEICSLKHEEYQNRTNENGNLIVSYDPITNTGVCGGIQIRGLKSQNIPRRNFGLKFESNNFLSFVNPTVENGLRFADFCFGVVVDNLKAIATLTHISIFEIKEEDQPYSIGSYLQKIFPNYKIKVKAVSKTSPEVMSKELFELVISPTSTLEKAMPQVMEGGFLLLKTTPGRKTPEGFNFIGKFDDGPEEELQLLKKVSVEEGEPEFIKADGNFEHLVKNLRNVSRTQNIVYIVVYKEPTEGIEAFTSRLQMETTVPLRWIFIFDQRAPPFNSEDPFYAEQLKKGLFLNVYSNGSWGSFYLYGFTQNSFKDDVNFTLECSEEVAPAYVALDLSENLLKLQQIEYSGKMKDKKIMGITKLVDHKKIVMDKYLTWNIPEKWSSEEGAATPLSYALAYHCLVIMGNLKPYETVLVTDGMTCLGQASIALALSIASGVFVTVNNDKEAALIKQHFPQLKEKNIIIHEDPKFYIKWKLVMKEKHIDVIINMLDGERFFSVLHFSGKFGRFFHFGKENMEKNKPLGSQIFLDSLSFFARSPDDIMNMSEEEKKTMHQLISDGIQKGIVKPLPRVVLPFNELKKIQSKAMNAQKRIKTLVAVNTIKSSQNFIKFNTNCSYIIFGDETEVWVDVAEWLIDRKARNLVISRRDETKRSQLRIPHMKKHKGVYVFDHSNVETLIREAKKIGQLAAVFYVSMKSSKRTETLVNLDRSFRDENSHFIALTKERGFVSEVCSARHKSGLPSTNFVWEADNMTIDKNLEFMGKINGRDPVIHVSPLVKQHVSQCRIGDLLPKSIDDLCNLGSNLTEEVRLTPLDTLTGLNRDAVKEFVPMIFVPGLEQEPLLALKPIIKNFLYPAFCLQIPDLKMSIPKMASFILPEIVKLNKGKVFNLVGISWGSHLAVELAKQLEEMGAIVGLILIEGPFLDAAKLISKSLAADLVSVIQEQSKSSGNVKVQSEIAQESTWLGKLNRVAAALNLPPEKEKDLYRASNFLHNNLQALMSHDPTKIKVKGPLTVLVSGSQFFDDKILWKLSKSISIRSFPVSNETLLHSQELWKILHGSVVSQAMSPGTVHSCSWPQLEEFIQQKGNMKLSDEFQPINMKFSFTF